MTLLAAGQQARVVEVNGGKLGHSGGASRRSASPDSSSTGKSLANGVLEILVEHPCGPDRTNGLERIELQGADIGGVQCIAADLFARKIRRIFGADHGVVHADAHRIRHACRDHHELRCERRIVASNRFINQHRHDGNGNRVITEQAQRGCQIPADRNSSPRVCRSADLASLIVTGSSTSSACSMEKSSRMSGKPFCAHFAFCTALKNCVERILRLRWQLRGRALSVAEPRHPE